MLFAPLRRLRSGDQQILSKTILWRTRAKKQFAKETEDMGPRISRRSNFTKIVMNYGSRIVRNGMSEDFPRVVLT
jgi:hypothetical protein